MENPVIKNVPVSDEHLAIRALTLAFSADPVARWIYPDPQQYAEYFPGFVSAFAGPAFAHGSAYHTDGYSGTALWLPPGVHPDAQALMSVVESTVSEQDRAQVSALLQEMDSYHPADPHWYLPLIGVDPAQQRKGYGSALLQYALAQCDRDNQPAYLESSSTKSIPFYERHGFERLGTIQVASSPPLFPMLRRPRGRG